MANKNEDHKDNDDSLNDYHDTACGNKNEL